MSDGDSPLRSFGPARRLLTLFVVLGVLLLFGRFYRSYSQAAWEGLKHCLGQMASFREQVDSMSNAIRRALDVRLQAPSPRERLQRLHEIERQYRETAQRLAVSIEEMQSSSGALQRLFQPGDVTAGSLAEFREWLTLEGGEDHPLLPTDDRIDHKLRVLDRHLAMYRECLRYELMEFAHLRTTIDACVEAKRRALDPLP